MLKKDYKIIEEKKRDVCLPVRLQVSLIIFIYEVQKGEI